MTVERLGTVANYRRGADRGIDRAGAALSANRRRGWSESVATRLFSTQAARKGAIDHGTTDFELGVAKADLVIVCTPVNRIAEDVIRAALAAPDEVLITDVGSSKRQIVEAVERHSRAAASMSAPTPLPVPNSEAQCTRRPACSKAACA